MPDGLQPGGCKVSRSRRMMLFRAMFLGCNIPGVLTTRFQNGPWCTVYGVCHVTWPMSDLLVAVSASFRQLLSHGPCCRAAAVPMLPFQCHLLHTSTTAVATQQAAALVMNMPVITHAAAVSICCRSPQ
jgi:hypothetical protein